MRDVIGGIFLFIWLLTIPTMIVGLINPRWVTPKNLEPMSRLKTFGLLALACTISMVLAAVILPTSSNSEKNQTQTKTTDMSSQVASDNSALSDSSSADVIPPQPVHQYTSIDGDEYLYASGISENDKSAGQTASKIVPFRYKGVRNGKITLISQGMTLTCDADCVIITARGPYGMVDRYQYTPDSVAGAAFTDAMNGVLKEHPSGN